MYKNFCNFFFRKLALRFETDAVNACNFLYTKAIFIKFLDHFIIFSPKLNFRSFAFVSYLWTRTISFVSFVRHVVTFSFRHARLRQSWMSSKNLSVVRTYSTVLHLRMTLFFLTPQGSANFFEVSKFRLQRTLGRILQRKIKLSCCLHADAKAERRYNSYSFFNSAVDGGEWSASRLGRALPPGKEPQYPLDRRLGGTQCWCEDRG
jgi:hypothetical protein